MRSAKLKRPTICCFAAILLFLSGPCHEVRGAEGSGPVFAIRGTLPWHNFLSGPTAWDEDQYRAYLDRLAGLGLNLIAFHCYTGGAQRYATYVEPLIRIQYRNIVPEAGFDTSLTARWGYRPLAVRDFAFGTSKLFSLPDGAEAFGSGSAISAQTKERRYGRAQVLMRRVVEMAHARGIQVAMGFEFGIHPPEFASVVPPDSWIKGAFLPDPTHPSSTEILQATIDDILRAYPGIDWIWLWLHEHTMFVGRAQPSARFRDILRRDSPLFRDAGSEDTVFTGVWSLAYIRAAHSYLAKRAPRVRLAVSGWGGERQLPSILPGLDRALPRDIVFACLNPALGEERQPPVLGEIAKHRQVWAIPWLEGDGGLWHLQPRVALLRDQIRLARGQRLNGVIAVHWRTEETRLNLQAFAQFARNPEEAPTVEGFYQEQCQSEFGHSAALELAPLLTRMDREQWFRSVLSPEYYPYDPQWGRLTGELKIRILDAVTKMERLLTATSDARHLANLRWLVSKLRFALLLDEVGRKMEPAYRLRARWFVDEVAPEGLEQEIFTARKELDSAPVEELFQTYSSNVRSQGELGILSSLNQKLWLQYRELDGFLKSIAKP